MSNLRPGRGASTLLAYLLAPTLLAVLIWYSGTWDFLANTRILKLLIDGGVVSFHDAQLGFVEGVADLGYYLKAIEPVEWPLVGVVIGIFWLFYLLKGVQFHLLARFYDLPGGVVGHARAFYRGELASQYLPFDAGGSVTVDHLEAEGGDAGLAAHVHRVARALILFEIGAFSLIGLVLEGWGTWLIQIFWALILAGVVYWWVREDRGDEPSLKATAARALADLGKAPRVLVAVLGLSLLAFGVEDIAAYLTAMSFSGEEVRLHAEFNVLLMGVVASYIARFVRLTPGGIGQFEWGFAAALYLGGLGWPEAAAIAVLDNLLRYLSFAIFYGVTTLRANLPPRSRPMMTPPAGATLWRRALLLAWAVVAFFLFDQLSFLLFDMWLYESLGLSSVFGTNLSMGVTLFAVGGLGMAASIIMPALALPVPKAIRSLVVQLGLMAGLLGGYFLSLEYASFLTVTGREFGEVDPVFGHDLSFYVFVLDSLNTAWLAATASAVLGLVSAMGCGYAAYRDKAAEGLTSLDAALGAMAAKPSQLQMGVLAVLAAVGVWLERYDLLFKDNSDSSIPSGASYVDVVGLFSNINYVWISSLVVLGLGVTALFYLMRLRARFEGRAITGPASARLLRMALILLVFDFGFKTVVEVRQALFVAPNEPVLQLDYIAHHMKATRGAFGLDNIEEKTFMPKGEGDPIPDVDALLARPTLKNIPLWPGFASFLERHLDIQHADRVIQTGGDHMVYGPSLDIFRQEQKLRTYYDFLSTDTVRYTIDGEKRLFVSAARETPLYEPVPWLAYFGQRYMLFTHGMGLVVAGASEVLPTGSPNYVVRDVPPKTDLDAFKVENPAIYYGEGSATMAFSNVDGVPELDYPTEQGRAVLPKLGDVGVPIDSFVKRIIFGWRAGQFFDVVFSGLIRDETRVHYFRTPVERLDRLAPFLYYDSNPVAVVADGRIQWLVNAMTTSDLYPYSQYEYLGDKSDERSVSYAPRPNRRINYVEDAVKATVDAATGAVRFYKTGEGPVVETWAEIYPDLFTDASKMTSDVKAQLTYPTQLFHLQFDDLYIYYHMNDPMYFFNLEDMWDDGDEVLGPILDEGEAITFSIEPYNLLMETGGALPADKDDVQFTMMMPFTNEKALNLRAVAMAYQDGEGYGKLAVLQVPKGRYVIGPEQADAIIDQDPHISQQISWWNRRGTEVIRGHTTLAIVDDEVIYIEPIFLRSKQNQLTQMKKVAVVFRGRPYLGDSVEHAMWMAEQDLKTGGSRALIRGFRKGFKERMEAPLRPAGLEDLKLSPPGDVIAPPQPTSDD